MGNLRTAVLAWLWARLTGRRFVLRIEDIDEERSSAEYAAHQLEDLATLGLDWDGPVARQSGNGTDYQAALDHLTGRGLTFECYCSRKEIHRAAASAPHVPPGRYPGTCRDLTEKERARRREELHEQGRVPAVRLRAPVRRWTVRDFRGEYAGAVDDVILRRGGQQPGWAYHLAVVVDDAAAGVDQVVRGEDLLDSAPSQALIAHLLGATEPFYVHVPLVVAPGSGRLAKRDGAMTLRRMIAEGRSAGDVVEEIGCSLGYPGMRSLAALAAVFDPARLPREPWVWEGEYGDTEL